MHQRAIAIYQPSILVADDEVQARKGLAELLRNRNYNVRLARSGKHAVTAVSGNNVGLVLMDIKMPGELDGIDATRQIQRLHPELPVVFLSAFCANAEYQRRVQEDNLRIAGCVDKPVVGANWDRLLSIVEKELGKAQMRALLKISASKGVRLADTLKFYEIMVLLFGVGMSPEEAVEEMRREIRSTDVQTGLLEQLALSLEETERHLTDVQLCQFEFAQFKTSAMERLWDAYQHQSKYRRQLALLVRMSVRKLSSLQLTREHLAALRLVLEKLSGAEATLEDVVECKKALRRSGIETLITLGEKTGELLQLYDEGVIEK